MLHTSPTTYYRAAGAVVAAAVLSFATHRASGQTVDLFGGTGSPASLSLAGTGAITSTSVTGSFGPGYNGTVSLGVGALNTISEGFTPLSGGTNAFAITDTGAVAISGTTSATRTFTGVSLTPGTYALTIAQTSGSTLGALGSINILLMNGSTTLFNTSTGQGLAGIVDVIRLFGSNNTETIQFAVPAGVTGSLSANITSSEPVTALGDTFTLESAVISPVPEPRTVATMLLGIGGLALLRIRRRVRTF